MARGGGNDVAGGAGKGEDFDVGAIEKTRTRQLLSRKFYSYTCLLPQQQATTILRTLVLLASTTKDGRHWGRGQRASSSSSS